jgi:hypothetical protein
MSRFLQFAIIEKYRTAKLSQRWESVFGRIRSAGADGRKQQEGQPPMCSLRRIPEGMLRPLKYKCPEMTSAREKAPKPQPSVTRSNLLVVTRDDTRSNP